MKQPDLEAKRKGTPILGFVSVVAPLIGFCGAWHWVKDVSDQGGDAWGFGRLFGFLGFMLLATAVGGLCAIIAASRDEKYWALCVVGVILNLAPWIYFGMMISH
ncbi:MAG TPA: hypothetical protein VN281_13020 [Verrucomicrobiae bacterium]|nr:hypothetical protein [Verrucomicrobiae bacterium]